jgi:hypothetical protein
MHELPDIKLGHLTSVWGSSSEPLIFYGPDRGHVMVIGQTRSGKSTYLENTAKQDIEAGAGVSFVDPHGDSYEHLLDYIPKWRAEDVVIFDPYGERERPVSINLLGGWHHPDDRVTWALGIVKMFRHLWRDTWGMRLQQILMHSVLALRDHQDSTFLSVLKLLTDPEYRDYVLKSCRNPVVAHFFEKELGKWGPNFAAEAINPVMSRAEQYLVSPIVQNIFGQSRSTIDFADIMDTRKICLANLAEGALEEDTVNLLGSLIVTKYLITGQQRYRVPEQRRVPHTLIVDEFPRFTTLAFKDVFTGSGKFKLHVMAAFQTLEQIKDEEVLAAVLQSRNAVAYSVHGADARKLVDVFGDESLEVLSMLERYQACVKLDVGGEPHSPIKLAMLPPIERPERKSRRGLIKKVSRERYAPKPRQAVEEHIKKTVFGWTAPARAGRRGEVPRLPEKKEYARPWEAGRKEKQETPVQEPAPVSRKPCDLCDRGIVRVRPAAGGPETGLLCA